MNKDEALKLALEALENSVDHVREDAYNAEQLYGNYPARQGKVRGLKVLADDHEKAITAIKAALANEALERKAENARELGLNYEPLETKDYPEQMAKLGWQVIDCPICGGGARAFTKQEAKDEPDHSDELTIAYMSGLHRGKELEQRTWVGLTAEEREQVQAESYGKVPHHVALTAAVEAKLMEKNK
jgi:hypothetical protein